MVKTASGVDILSHVLVPKHRVLSEKETKSLFEKYNISYLQLPEIKSNDAVIEHIGAKVGDVIEITRKGASGYELYYRRVSK